MQKNTLYSYRRCPYAMRARMALVSAGIQCEVHEIDFKNKPAAMLEISPKGTVPVLHTADGAVIDESREIMIWALSQNNPENWFDCDKDDADALINKNDGAFKAALDWYKYPARFEGEDCSGARELGLQFILKLNARLANHAQLMGDKTTVTDIAIFPFIRQFAAVDREWFDGQDIAPLHAWLDGHVNSTRFKHIMQKHKENPYNLI